MNLIRDVSSIEIESIDALPTDTDKQTRTRCRDDKERRRMVVYMMKKKENERYGRKEEMAKGDLSEQEKVRQTA